MDDIMQGQLDRYELDLVRWGYPKEQIKSKMEARRLEVETLRQRPKVDSRVQTQGAVADLTFGKFPWLPLCDIY